MFSKLNTDMLSILQTLPKQCHLCRLTINKNNHHYLHTLWCNECIQLIYQQMNNHPHHFLCFQCGLPTSEPNMLCGQCLRSPPPWDRLFCIGEYKTPIREIIHQFKYQQHYWLAKPLAHLLAPSIGSPAPTCIPVPLHWRRQLIRGFNQSELLAKQLIGYWKKQPFDIQLSSIFERQKHTTKQQGLNQKQRQRNLRQAFKLKKKIKYTHVALVDDVVTTGSTLAPLCQQLRKIGVKKIDIYCLCRTSLE